ncbi:MAG: AI-2E family transporter [Bdellovibrionales bacterium]
MRSLSQKTLRRVNRWKLVALLTVLVGAIVLILSVENLLFSSLVGFVVAYMLGPIVNFLERKGLSRTVSAAMTFLFTGSLLVLVGFWVAPYLGNTLYSLKEDMPRFIVGVGQFISDMEARVRSIAGPLSTFDLTTKVESYLTTWTNHFFDSLPRFLRTTVTVMLLGPFLAFFMVKDGRILARGVLGLVPNHLFEAALSLLHQINVQIGQFVRARILESFIVGLVTASGLLIISYPYAALLGIVAGLTNLVPYLGPILGAVPAFLIAAVNHYSSLDIAAVASVYIVAQLIDAGFLIPLMVAKIVDLHPVTVIIVMIAGAQILGVLGVILSIPVASTLKVTFTTAYRHLIDTRTN